MKNLAIEFEGNTIVASFFNPNIKTIEDGKSKMYAIRHFVVDLGENHSSKRRYRIAAQNFAYEHTKYNDSEIAPEIERCENAPYHVRNGVYEGYTNDLEAAVRCAEFRNSVVYWERNIVQPQEKLEYWENIRQIENLSDEDLIQVDARLAAVETEIAVDTAVGVINPNYTQWEQFRPAVRIEMQKRGFKSAERPMDSTDGLIEAADRTEKMAAKMQIWND
jgi:hypothetical protein